MRVPPTLEAFMTFLATHADLWDTNHAALGISATASAAYKSLASTAQGNYNAQVTAYNKAKGATATQKGTTQDARQMTADLIRSIEVFAAAQADPTAVYTLAQIPAPAVPSPAPPPGTPNDFKVGLNDDGSVLLSWKCPNPIGTQGTIYEVRRKPAGPSAFTFIGATGVRKFTDDTLMSGSSPVTYQVTAVRSTQRGEPASFNVTFGVGGGGIAVATITETAGVAATGPTKLAA